MRVSVTAVDTGPNHLQAASSTSATDDKMGKIVEPSVFNQTGVRVGSILLAVGGAALAGKASPFSASTGSCCI